MKFSSSSLSWCSLVVLTVTVLVVAFPSAGHAMPPPICLNQKLPLNPYVEKLCSALDDIAQFSLAMEEYLDAKVIKNSMPLSEPEVKRQDLDHVFLRFGRSK